MWASEWKGAQRSSGRAGGVFQYFSVYLSAADVSSFIYASMLSHSVGPTLASHSPPGSSVHGIVQARILEWVAIAYSKDTSFSNGDCNHLRLALVSFHHTPHSCNRYTLLYHFFVFKKKSL